MANFRILIDPVPHCSKSSRIQYLFDSICHYSKYHSKVGFPRGHKKAANRTEEFVLPCSLLARERRLNSSNYTTSPLWSGNSHMLIGLDRSDLHEPITAAKGVALPDCFRPGLGFSYALPDLKVYTREGDCRCRGRNSVYCFSQKAWERGVANKVLVPESANVNSQSSTP